MEYVKFSAEGGVGTLVIDRPRALNALNDQVIRELDQTLDQIDLETVRCVVVRGGGEKAFVAGADIAQMSALTKAEGQAFGKLGNDVFRKLETLPIPTIAAVCGFALGGGSAPIPRSSVSRRPAWASPPALAARSGWPGSSAPAWRSS